MNNRNEEKELLLKDLCARLPYDMIINVNDGKYRKDVKLHPHYIFDWDAKPYLRPMSSMTEEEYREFGYDVLRYTPMEFDWLNAHHFDYRDLIGKGLALKAPDGMYNF